MYDDKDVMAYHRIENITNRVHRFIAKNKYVCAFSKNLLPFSSDSYSGIDMIVRFLQRVNPAECSIMILSNIRVNNYKRISFLPLSRSHIDSMVCTTTRHLLSSSEYISLKDIFSFLFRKLIISHSGQWLILCSSLSISSHLLHNPVPYPVLKLFAQRNIPYRPIINARV